MRWGDWYRFDARTLAHRQHPSMMVDLESMRTPAHVDEFVWGNRSSMTVEDVVYLHRACNDMVWQAFDYDGIGDVYLAEVSA